MATTAKVISGYICEISTEREADGFRFTVRVRVRESYSSPVQFLKVCEGWTAGTKSEALKEAEEYATKRLPDMEVKGYGQSS